MGRGKHVKTAMVILDPIQVLQTHFRGWRWPHAAHTHCGKQETSMIIWCPRVKAIPREMATKEIRFK